MATNHNAWLEKFKTFEASLNGQSSQPIHQIRKAAISEFEQTSLPTSADEAWKTVNVSMLSQSDFSLAQPHAEGSITAETLAPYLLPDTIQLVFINGYFAKDLSQISDLPDGVRAESLAEALNNNPDTVPEQFSHVVGSEQLTFTTLNTAFLQDGAYIHIAKNTVCERPIHLLFLSQAENTPTVTHTRNLIIAEDNSQLTLIETYAGINEQTYLTNSVTEFLAGDNAQIDHYKLELETLQGIHIANQHAKLGRSTNITSHAFSIGGAFVRNDVSAHLAGEGCEATVNGLYLLEGNQHIDNYTLLEHAEPHCPSHELYKGILGDRSRAIFRGKILVHQKAQHTDAYQKNENLLLSDNARVNTKPQLEIYADQVKCSHGAIIGQLNDDALFYLQARGISKTEAQSMLLKAFADDIVDRVKIASLRQHLETIIQAKFDRLYHAKETA
jgi:Fe-S cluster assembly protein SufD